MRTTQPRQLQLKTWGIGFAGAGLLLSMGLTGCGGGGPSSPPYNSGFEGGRTYGSLSKTERIQFCKSLQNYFSDQLGLETYCQYSAEANARPSSGTDAEAAFRASCTTGYQACIASGAQGAEQRRAQNVGSCDFTPDVATSGCEVSVDRYEDCAARQMDIYKSIAASNCENSASTEAASAWPEDFVRDCDAPINGPCSTP